MSTATIHRQEEKAKAATLLLAFELGVKKWRVGFATDFTRPARRCEIPGGDVKALQRELREAKRYFGLPPTSSVISCYEAGRDGFWLHRYLASQGVQNLVVDSSSIEVNRRRRRAKTDRLDVDKLLKLLIRHVGGEPAVWSIVHVPEAEVEDARSLHRELRTLAKEQTRSINRIKGLLMNHGVYVEKLGHNFLSWLGGVRLWDGSPLPAGVRGRIEREYERWQVAHQQRLVLEGERRVVLQHAKEDNVEKIRRLQQLRGIGSTSAWLYVREFFGWREFRNRREVGALAGLVPTPFQSGETQREQGIGKAGNRYVRGLAIEIAWGWLRHQPESALSRWYQRRFGGGGPRQRKIGIVALARKLLIALWRYVERGVVPEGARLKADAAC